MKLERHYVEKPWGRDKLPERFHQNDGRRIGEVWFEHPSRQLPLLVKYIFTSERLSVQVHPNDDQARALGQPNGKTECWYILEAEAGATLALGFRAEVDEETVRSAISDGTIEELLGWKPVRSGDFFYVPAGTVHAIGAGISLLELQQNSDVTYRLYDYGRPRELHVQDGMAVARLEPYSAIGAGVEDSGSALLIDGPHFSLARLEAGSDLANRFVSHDRWVMPVRGTASSSGQIAGTGECLFLSAGEPLVVSVGGTALLGASRSV